MAGANPTHMHSYSAKRTVFLTHIQPNCIYYLHKAMQCSQGQRMHVRPHPLHLKTLHTSHLVVDLE